MTAPVVADPARASARPVTGVRGTAAPGRAAVVEPAELPWPKARAIVSATRVPTFPAAVFDVRDSGRTAGWNKGSRRALLERMIADGLTEPHQRVVPGSGRACGPASCSPTSATPC